MTPALKAVVIRYRDVATDAQGNLFSHELTFYLLDGIDWRDAEIPRSAGLRFHPPDCSSEEKGYDCLPCMAGLTKVWWTDRPELAAQLASYAAPEVKKMLQPAIDRQAASRALDSSLRVPAPIGQVYRPFQRAGIAGLRMILEQYPGALLADDMGIGKTIQALGLINLTEGFNRVLILCPKSLQINWQREAAAWLLPKAQGAWNVWVAGESEPCPGETTLAIVNYDKLVGKPGRVVGPSLAHIKWDLIICDEAHALKNPDAERSRVVLQHLRLTARKQLYLTGTPIENRPIEIQPIVEACAPGEFDFWSFARRFADAHQEWVPQRRGRMKQVWKFDGHSNLEELALRLRATIMVRRLKSEVLTELPPKIRQVIELPAPGGVRSRLKAEADEFVAKGFEDALAEHQANADLAHATGDKAAFRLAVEKLKESASVAFTEMAAVRHELGLAKVPAALGWLEGALESGKKMIVFAHHLDVIDALVTQLRSALGEAGAVVKVDGRDEPDERQAAVDRFQGEAGVRVFVGQISAAGVGLTLTKASLVVFCESDWVPGKVTQAEDRAHRIGQTESVNVVHLCFDGSLDARMLRVVIDKQDVQDLALDAPFKIQGKREEPTRGDKEKKSYPVATADERVMAKLAMRRLAEQAEGVAGFSKLDLRVGRELAARRDYLTDGQVFLAKKLAKRYHRQLTEEMRVILLGGGGGGVTPQ